MKFCGKLLKLENNIFCLMQGCSEKSFFESFLQKAGLFLDIGSAWALARAVLVFMSLGTAHYVEFLWSVPFEILSIVSSKYVVTFVAAFTVYVMSCYCLCCSIAFAISQFYYCFIVPVVAGIFGVNRFLGRRITRSVRRMYRERVFVEKIFYWVFFIPMFPFFLSFVCLKFDCYSVGATAKLLTFLSLLQRFLRRVF
ncbi:hypothetical protein D3C77_242500 [compost metagenome]|jgi:hypothetical protein